jgi:hypothetical protein
MCGVVFTAAGREIVRARRVRAVSFFPLSIPLIGGSKPI